ncbi:MAG: hypothetical protein ACFE8N_11200 [Promethearchaeota archaeon]
MTTNKEKIKKLLEEIDNNKKKKGIQPKTPQDRINAQLDLPVGFDLLNKKLTLRDVLIDKIELDFSKLSFLQKAEITRERIKKQRRFEMYISRTFINKERALKELSRKQIENLDTLKKSKKYKKHQKAKKKIKIARSLIKREFILIELIIEKYRKKIDNGDLIIEKGEVRIG